jgi:hypothetical protein
MSNASSGFHWLLESNRLQAHWTAQSYGFGSSFFSHAKLVVVYDLASPEYQHHATDLLTWVEHGGKLVFWDVKPATALPPFLEGIQFQNDSSHEAPGFVAFRETASPLLRNLRASHQVLDAQCNVEPNIAGTSPDWQELAYTVVESVNTEHIQWGYGTFGPRWTSTLNSARRPLLLTKKNGLGEVLLAELGSCNVLPKSGMTSGQVNGAPVYLRELARNILRWGQESVVGEKTVGEN